MEAPRVLLCVACQEDVFRVENPFLISTADVSRAHFCAVSERDENVHLPTRSQRQRSQAHVDNYERRCTDPWILLNSGLRASEISELRRTAKRHEPPDEIKEEDDFLTGKELKLFQSVAARLNYLAMDRPDLLHSVKGRMRKMASPRARDLIALKRVARCTIKYPRMACGFPGTELDSRI